MKESSGREEEGWLSELLFFLLPDNRKPSCKRREKERERGVGGKDKRKTLAGLPCSAEAGASEIRLYRVQTQPSTGRWKNARMAPGTRNGGHLAAVGGPGK